MATVYPFRGLRARPDLADRIASVPYDVVNRAEARALAKDNELSFLHVTKPEIDLADDVDEHDDRVYEQGKKRFFEMITKGQLVQDDKPCFYIYALTMNGQTQTGVVLGASVAEYDKNIVRKHEHTRPDKENDRVHHIRTTTAQTGTVFLVHRRSEAIGAVVKATTGKKPAVDLTASDQIRHQLWVIDDAAYIKKIAEGFAALGPIYIADGHHRSAAASRVAAAMRKPGTAADAPFEMFLAVSFPEDEVRILPYNRVVKDLAGKTAWEFLAEVKKRFDVTDGKPSVTQAKQFALYLDGKWYTVKVRAGSYDAKDPVKRLDVSLVQDQLLAPLLNITDPRRDQRIDFVGGIRGDAELERRVREGCAVAISMHPTSSSDLFAIADAEQVMPPKSTWFEPKLRDGMVVHRI